MPSTTATAPTRMPACWRAPPAPSTEPRSTVGPVPGESSAGSRPGVGRSGKVGDRDLQRNEVGGGKDGAPYQAGAMLSTYLNPVPVLKTTMRSSGVTCPEA